VLVSALIDAGKMQADKRNDQQLSDTDWCTIAVWSVRSLWRRISALDPDWYFDHQDFTLAGGSNGCTFDLSTLTGTGGAHTFAAMHGLDLYPDTSRRQTVPRINFRERNAGRFSRWLPTTFTIDRCYDERGTVLTITPYEAAGAPYRVYYRYEPYLFTGPTDTNPLDFQMAAYDEYISIRMAMRALKIEESSADPLAQDLADLWAEIRAEHSRDDQEAAIIADVEGDGWPWR